MRYRLGIGCMVLAMFCFGCATPQIIDITSEPAKAAVSVNNEFIGKTPCTFDVEDTGDYSSLKVVVEKGGFEADMKRLCKKPDKSFPTAVHFVMQPVVRADDLRPDNGDDHTTSNQQQMQGPTIVIPGSGSQPVPIQITPAGQ